MIGLDTNVLVRYLVADDPQQTRAAIAILEGQLTAAQPGYINCVVAAELAWVLSRTHRYSWGEIATTMDWLLSIDNLVVEDADLVSAAAERCRNGDGDFADALIGVANHQGGCVRTLTFDRGTRGLPEFQMIEVSP